MVHIDYVWIDGLASPLVRSKTKIVKPTVNERNELEVKISEWNFDGSSTGQASTQDSEMLLKPLRVYKLSDQHYVALCEVCNPTTGEAHESNFRALLRKKIEEVTDKGLWIGFEQEFFITKDNKNVLWPEDGLPPNDTRYYCSSGAPIRYRKLIREHATLCNNVGISVVGYNTEVSPGQWEYQVFADDPLKAADDLWISRYLLQLCAEAHEIGIDWHPKPHEGWNGSGCHTNFSTSKMREEGGEEFFKSIMEAAGKKHTGHMLDYGELNRRRMTGSHETSSYDTFTWGVGSRNTSIRIPNTTSEQWTGYAEDRRPSSNCDPYKVVRCVLEYVD
jgi:glutamine synthetase